MPLEVVLYLYCLNFASDLSEKHSDVRGGFIGTNRTVGRFVLMAKSQNAILLIGKVDFTSV
jgi:hypothetical protein